MSCCVGHPWLGPLGSLPNLLIRWVTRAGMAVEGIRFLVASRGPKSLCLFRFFCFFFLGGGISKRKRTELPFSPTAESFGVSAQIGSGVVRCGPEVRLHEGSTRVPRGFLEVLRGLQGGASTKKSTACCWGCLGGG